MELFTVKETAQILRVSPITVRRYIASGQLAAERVGRGIRVRREAMEDFVTPVVSQTNNRESVEVSRNPPVDSRHLDDNWVEIWSPSSPDGSVWVHVDKLDEYLDARGTEEGSPLGNIIGIGRSGEPTNIAEHKDDYLADAYLGGVDDEEDDPELDELLGKPCTMSDPLWSVFGTGESYDPDDSETDDDELPTLRESLGDFIGIGRSGSPTDVSANKYEYLADAYESDKG